MSFALKKRAIVIGAVLLLIAAGLYSFHELDIEAYPDPVQPRIEITTQPFGWSAEEVERLVTIPLEAGLSGLRNLEAIRTISLYGVSDIKLYFSWDSDYYWDRAETLNRLGLIPMPPGIVPGFNYDNPIGEIYRYYITSPTHDLTAEKSEADWCRVPPIRTRCRPTYLDHPGRAIFQFNA
jgi:cobalt-zinc-cadmium resistance protein CzcA